MKVSVVVGGQFGSEAKGHVTQQVARKSVSYGADVLNVRVAGPNAGHCAVDDNGTKWALRQVPVGATLRKVALGIAAGSEIDLPVLLDEIDRLDTAGFDVANRLTVDPEATMIYGMHKEQEAQRGLSATTGNSTGKGIGAARADRALRRARRLCDDNFASLALADRRVKIRPLTEIYYPATHVIVEGAQGYGLGLHAGYYPDCTSSDTRAIDFLAMAGLSPWSQEVASFEVWVVARVYPIRIAGHSGPLKGETSWADLNLPEELTTVTQKVRRVGGWDRDLIRAAVEANGGRPVVRVALTMMDQMFPKLEGDRGSLYVDWLELKWADPLLFVADIERDANAPVKMITTSDRTAIWL